MSEAEISHACAQSMDAENRRRELASQRPGHGTQIPLAQPVSAAGVGLSDVPMPVVGEGYDLTPPVVAPVSKAYGPPRPVYADPVVGGLGFTAGKSEPAISVWIGQRSAAADGAVVVSPSRPSRLGWLLGRLRHH
jgi:hypothetical protein